MYQRSVLVTLPKIQNIDIEFNNVTWKVKTGFRKPSKQILYGVSGRFRSGELTAIMGPSGAGKSSLLNLLTGFDDKNAGGKIEYRSGTDTHNFDEYRRAACYIQQDDRLHGLFTVTEVMQIAADLKLGHNLSTKSKELLIDDILDTLDLVKHKDTRCDRLSGGQRKRLSIALELIDNPPVMFLDEPTTGLDSSSTLQCIAMLQHLARGGRTIVCTIHQPSASIFEMFDHIYLVANGQCMYQGSPVNAVPYLSNIGLNCPKYHNPADYLIEVVCKEYGDFHDALIAAAAGNDPLSWRSNALTKEVLLATNHSRKNAEVSRAHVLINPPSEILRFFVLFKRSMVQLYRDWTVTHLKFIVHFLVGILLGLFYSDSGTNAAKVINNVGFLMVNIVYLCYTSMMPAALRFSSELAVVQKEQFNNWYKLRTYYAANLLSNLPIQVSFTIVFTTVAYFMSGQPPVLIRYSIFLISSMLTTIISETLGLILGTIANPINGTFIGAIATCTFLLYGGFLVLFQHMTVFMYHLSYLSYMRYVLEMLVKAIYGLDREKLLCPQELIIAIYECLD